MELRDLYNTLIKEGCINFYIDGIGGPKSDDVYCLGFDNKLWTVCYIERGQKSEPVYSTNNRIEAINYYFDFISKIEHWHLILFTRSQKILFDFMEKLVNLNVRLKQNDIPDFCALGDQVFRLFVLNKDIFTVKDILVVVPYVDQDLKAYIN